MSELVTLDVPSGQPHLASALAACDPTQVQRSSLKRKEVKEPALLLSGFDLPQLAPIEGAGCEGFIRGLFGLTAEHWQ